VDQSHKRAVLNRLKTVRGHLDGVIRMVEAEEYCVELMKQIAALQSSLERANRLVLTNHLETCFSDAVHEGRGPAAIAELLETLKFNEALTGPDLVLLAALRPETGTPPTPTHPEEAA
jgi:CsoR family transcriptional regulator, copper-sensing transcriptional repressor